MAVRQTGARDRQQTWRRKIDTKLNLFNPWSNCCVQSHYTGDGALAAVCCGVCGTLHQLSFDPQLRQCYVMSSCTSAAGRDLYNTIRAVSSSTGIFCNRVCNHDGCLHRLEAQVSGNFAEVSGGFAGGCCYMCCREQHYWQLTPLNAIEPDYHVPASQAPQAQAMVQSQPAVGIPV